MDAIVSGELGVRISKAFAEFESEPIGAASLAQVHRAYMRDGRAVVVKVQRPNIREQIVEDLEALEAVATFLDTHTELGKRYEFGNMLIGLRKSLFQELDFKAEAGNLAMFGTTCGSSIALLSPNRSWITRRPECLPWSSFPARRLRTSVRCA